MLRIKKYANRRLYDTERSTYINLDDLAGLIRDGHQVEVRDAKTDEDLTREVLLQVVLEVLKGGELLPTGMLRRIIRATGTDPASRLLRQQLASGLQLMSAQLDQLETVFARTPVPPAPAAPLEPDSPDVADAELAALRAKLEGLEARLKR